MKEKGFDSAIGEFLSYIIGIKCIEHFQKERGETTVSKVVAQMMHSWLQGHTKAFSRSCSDAQGGMNNPA